MIDRDIVVRRRNEIGPVNLFNKNITATSIAIDQATPLTLCYEVGCTGATTHRPA
jgi:hypothetical protein